MSLRKKKTTTKTRADRPITQALALGHGLADQGVVEILDRYRERNDLERLITRVLDERGYEQPHEVAFLDLATYLPPAQRDKLAQYSNGRSLQQSAAEEVAFALGVGVGIHLAHAGGTR